MVVLLLHASLALPNYIADEVDVGDDQRLT